MEKISWHRQWAKEIRRPCQGSLECERFSKTKIKNILFRQTIEPANEEWTM